RDSSAAFVKKVGSVDDAFAPTLMSIYQHNLPMSFSERTEKESQNLKIPTLSPDRLDLTKVPFVTIDGADARDFDDAVFAEPDTDAQNPGGWHLMIAIADVAWYVRPGSPLDRDAWLRGNSVYFPDRVLPMLPFELSAGVCSLKPGEARGAMICDVWIDAKGYKIRHDFKRALIKSARRLTYTEVEEALQGRQPIVGMEKEINHLKSAYALLAQRRRERGVIEINVPERQVILNDKGQIIDIKQRDQLDSMKLIEEFMILSNVAAAEVLEQKGLPTMYRIHDRPSSEKIENLNDFLRSIGQKADIRESSDPSDFNAILTRSAGSKRAFAINEFVLRSQSQAQYNPENIGHFGLALMHYAHFTSPIRRYADILVHRALIKALKLGEGGLSDEEIKTFEETARHISYTERQAAAAENDANDRYVAGYLKDKIGSAFTARISSVTGFGLFVRLDEFGADGLIPMRALSDDFYEFDDRRHVLVGRANKKEYAMGDMLRVILQEAIPVTGGLVFSIAGLSREKYPPRSATPQKKPPQKHHKNRRKKRR
ncbi:MAG: VacB/RNase II family 3'-5' exoribonuclease, partial [Lactobacillales bacterium]|nr:VacB/RNase II family 3'-5' exoribonuclease [Lactobacillales bacterium]